MKKQLLIIMSTFFVGNGVYAQDVHDWSVTFGIGGSSTITQDVDFSHHNDQDNEGELYFINGEYFISKHDALTGGLYYENRRYMNSTSEAGMIYFGNLGIQAGAKHYIFANKWIFQPFIGADIYTNFINLNKTKGMKNTKDDSENQFRLEYTSQSPALSLSPQIGTDLYIFKSLALTFAYHYVWGVYGRNDVVATCTSGNTAGSIEEVKDRNCRNQFTIGFKVDFPFQKITEKGRNGLIEFLFGWISPNHGWPAEKRPGF